MADTFFDTNTLLYLIGADTRKAAIIEPLLRAGGTISVQVLNEFANVASRKRILDWPEIQLALAPVRATCAVTPLTLETHDRATALARRYRYGFYDSLILAAALLANCAILYSEDLQHGQIIDGSLTILDPFA